MARVHRVDTKKKNGSEMEEKSNAFFFQLWKGGVRGVKI